MTTLCRALRLAPLAVLLAAPALARELHWRALEVVAELEADGSLRVAETQTMVMSGDWNGGERVFRLEPGQRLELIGLTRIAPDGAEIPLREGDLDAVDEFDWQDRKTLRWRSRLPSDPPFAATELVYRLELRYRGVLTELDAGRYRLDHDFAFPDRDGPIERFRLTLTLGPGWQALEPVPAAIEAGPLPPGDGFVLTRELAWSGARLPAGATVPRPSPRGIRLALGLLAVAALERWLAWWRRDRRLGRFAAVDPDAVDRAWLEARVFAEPPEVVGAAWDRSVGRAEVAATLARLVAEGKLAARVERRGWGIFGRDELHLERKVPLAAIDDGARPLLQGLFPGGSAETDTARLREHYRRSGFDPVSKIRSDLERRVKGLRGFAAGSPRPRRALTLLLLAAGAVALGAGAIRTGSPGPAIGLAIALTLVALPGWIGAGVGGSRLGWPLGALVAIAAALAGLALALRLFGRVPGMIDLGLAGGALLAAGYARSFFNLLASRESPAALARRQELAAARRWLRRELGRAEPQLDDRWLPWLVAFGLTPEMDRWFRAWGGATKSGIGPLTGGGGSAGGGGWSGGGGAFGGAGATASFAAAVSTMAAGVPSPSSSGGGGGGGGGGSSGGGGGGGW